MTLQPKIQRPGPATGFAKQMIWVCRVDLNFVHGFVSQSHLRSLRRQKRRNGKWTFVSLTANNESKLVTRIDTLEIVEAFG
jgi:hypothetical protein